VIAKLQLFSLPANYFSKKASQKWKAFIIKLIFL